MKIMKTQGALGKEITIYIPETEEDLKMLYEMQDRDLLDETDYMHGEKKQKLKIQKTG